MSTNDLFNNPSNDYVNPGLAPCSGTSDSYTFEFLQKKEAGIVSGADILQAMDLSEVSIPITTWLQEKKTLSSGEVIFVPGLTKALLNRSQQFDIPATGYVDSYSPSFMILDFSINYYYNFRYFDINIEASANIDENINIADAVNAALLENSASATMTYDPSYFKFTGNGAGYDFDISNVTLTLVDASMAQAEFPINYVYDPFIPLNAGDDEIIPQIFVLDEDLDSEVPAAKYPNGAQIGYLLKTTYPSTAGVNDMWAYTNTVDSPYIVYNETESAFIRGASISLYESLTYDPNLVWPDIVVDVSRNGYDISINDVILTAFDPSIINSTVDGSIISANWILSSIIVDSSISDSVASLSSFGFPTNTPEAGGIGTFAIGSTFYVSTSNTGNYLISDSSISDSIFSGTPITTSFIQDSSYFDSSISESILNVVDVSGGIISLSKMEGLDTLSIMTNSIVSDSSVKLYEAINTTFTNTFIFDSSLYMGDVSSGFIFDTNISTMNLFDVSIVNGDVFDVALNNVFANGSYISRATIIDSEFRAVILNNDTIIADSSIQNSYINTDTAILKAYGLTVADASNQIVYVNNTDIYDTSINNAIITDSSIWTSYIEDSSLIRCTVYNSVIDDTVTIDSSSRIMTVNAEWNVDASYATEAVYEKFSKRVDVGRSGAGTSKILSASEYLDYINTNDLWDKVGPLMVQISVADPDNSTTKNLVGGFYVFNPHTFPIQVEYMLIN